MKNDKPEKADLNDLEKFYTSEGQSVAGPIDRRPRRSVWQRLLFVAVSLFALASLIAWLGFYVLGIFEAQQKGKLELTIEAPEKNIIGETLNYRIILKNNSSEPLQNIRLTMSYPDGFILDEASLTPTGQAKNYWEADQLESMASREILLAGRLLGEPGNLKTIYGEVKYKLPNLRSELQTSSSTTTALEPSRLVLSWQGTPDARPGDKADYSLSYQYDGQATLPSSKIAIVVPANFLVTQTDPAIKSLGELNFDLPELKNGDKGDLKISGSWQTGTDVPAIIEAKLQLALPSGVIVDIAKKEIQTLVVGADVSVRVQVNGSDQPSALSLGDTMKVALLVDNSSDKTVSDLEVTLLLEGGIIDWSHLNLPDGAKVNGQSISWTSGPIPQLDRLTPKTKTTLNLSVPLKVVAPSDEGSWQISLSPRLAYHKLDGEVVDKTYEGAGIQVPVSSPLALLVEARYFTPEGEALGTGPLPPKVGVATRYRLIWRLQGAVHRLVNVTVQATLPDGVSLVPGSASQAFGDFSSAGSKLNWKLAAIEAGIQPSLEMMIELTPRATDVGKILVLSGQTKITATDDVTAGSISATGSVATTNLDSDSVARGKGVVEAAE